LCHCGCLSRSANTFCNKLAGTVIENSLIAV
jgi:hypothetical protein